MNDDSNKQGNIRTGDIDADSDVKIYCNEFTLEGTTIAALGSALEFYVTLFKGTQSPTIFDSASLFLDGTYSGTEVLRIESTNIELGGSFSLQNTRVEFVKGIEGSNLQVGSEVSLAAPEIEVEVEGGDEEGLAILKELGLLEEEAGASVEPSKVMEPLASERAQLGGLLTPMEAAKVLNRLIKLLQNMEKMKGMADQVENADDPEKRFGELRYQDEWLLDAQVFLGVAKALLLQKGKNPKFAGQLFLIKFCTPLRGQYPATYEQLQKMSAEERNIMLEAKGEAQKVQQRLGVHLMVLRMGTARVPDKQQKTEGS